MNSQCFETELETICVGREAWPPWPGLESAWPSQFGGRVCGPLSTGQDTHCPIEQRAHPLGSVGGARGVCLVPGSEDGLVLWLCVAQPCTFSCILLPSVASLQSLSLFGR